MLISTKENDGIAEIKGEPIVENCIHNTYFSHFMMKTCGLWKIHSSLGKLARATLTTAQSDVRYLDPFHKITIVPPPPSLLTMVNFYSIPCHNFSQSISTYT